MATKYFILEVKGVTDSRYGDCAVIMANPVQVREVGAYSSQSVTPYVCSETVRFFFPDDESILEPILRRARTQTPWEPNMDHFIQERIFDENAQKHIEIYRHLSFFGDMPSAVGNSSPIQVSQDKQYILSQQYQDYMRRNYLYDPIDLQVYVGRLRDNDPNFFAWLFDDNSLRGCSEWELDEEYLDAWQRFYSRCDPYFNETGEDEDDEF
jgi:hypothetical protein